MQALKVRAGEADPASVRALLEEEGLTPAARKKTRTVLNRLWLEPRAELADFASRGVALYRSGASPRTLHWGMAVSAYPFFTSVARIVGRLTAIQGGCTSAEVHRRMSEQYGEREGTYRMTNMVLQTQTAWGAIARAGNGRRIVRGGTLDVSGMPLTGWLLEAAVRASGRPIALSSLHTLPALFPFALQESIGYSAGNSPFLELRSTGAGRGVVALAE